MYPFQNQELNAEERVRDLLARLTLEEKIGLLSTHQSPVERLGIGEWYVGHEIARGLVNREQEDPSTVFPQPIGMAASFDPDMMYEIGKTAGREARAYYNEKKKGGLMVWGPTVDLSRDPRWGRNEECYGEDPYLTGEMTIAYTKGLRGDGKVYATIPTLKHFCANNHEEGRRSDSANLNPRLKHEHYYAAFRAPIMRGGAESIMTAYNDICHAPAVMNHDLKNVLKKEWGLGFIVTDGGDFSQNVTAHKHFTSHAKALQACLYAGTDCMTDVEENVHAAARKALAEGLISETDIDCAIGNILRARVQLGHFDESTPFDHLTRADVNTEADRALNLRAAKEGMVLLENNGILPLDRTKAGMIALLGAYADCDLPDWYTGTSSYHITIKKGLEEAGFEVVTDEGWDIVKLEAPNGKFLRLGEDNHFYADADEEHAEEFYYCLHDDKHRWVNLKSVKTGRFLRVPDGDVPEYGGTLVYAWFTPETLHVDHHSGTGKYVISHYLHGRQFTLDENDRLVVRKKARPDDAVMFSLHTQSDGRKRLLALAEQADTVIYCAGNDPEQVARECYDRKTIRLPMVQQEAVDQLTQHYPNTILLMTSSYPFALEFSNAPAAILWSSHAGPELGHAAAATLFGDNNPAGRLPQTWYACDEDLPDIRDYDIMKNKMTYRWFDGKPLYPFGYGLSYSKFDYSRLSCEIGESEILVCIDVTNTSDVDGDEVVQVYAHAHSARIRRALRQLCGFKRVHVRAGETVRCEIAVPLRELEIYDVSRERFCLESGEYTLMIGASSEDIRLSETLTIEGEIIPPRDLTKETAAQLYDAEEGTEIFTDCLSGVTHVRNMAWSSMLVFQNADLSGAKSLIVRASVPCENAVVRVYLDQEDTPAAEFTALASDGYADFHAYTVPLHADGCHDLRLAFGNNCCIRSLQITK